MPFGFVSRSNSVIMFDNIIDAYDRQPKTLQTSERDCL
jgi:hypothetical protein